MSEHELATLLRDAEPIGDHPPHDVAALWLDGRRRARRTRAAWAAGAGLVAVVLLVAGAVVATAGDRSSPGRLDVAGPPDPATTVGAGPTSAGGPTTGPGDPEPGPVRPDGAEVPRVEGFPMAMRLDRTELRPGDGGAVEVGLVPVDPAAPEPVTVAIPLALDQWDPVADTWSPVVDLYDESRAGHPSWLPHGIGSAWYEWAPGPHGLPVVLPVDELAPGSYRVCARLWRSADGPP